MKAGFVRNSSDGIILRLFAESESETEQLETVLEAMKNSPGSKFVLDEHLASKWLVELDLVDASEKPVKPLEAQKA